MHKNVVAIQHYSTKMEVGMHIRFVTFSEIYLQLGTTQHASYDMNHLEDMQQVKFPEKEISCASVCVCTMFIHARPWLSPRHCQYVKNSN